MSAGRRVFVIAAGIAQLALFVAAQVDLFRRRPDQVRGSKMRWRLLAFVNTLGPLAYFRWGRLPD